MQITEFFYFAVLTITVTSSVAQPELSSQKQVGTRPRNRIARRETSLLFDSNFPVEPAYSQPTVVYRRVTRRHKRKPKPNYGPPRPYKRSKYGAPKKKSKGKRMSYKYGPPPYKKVPVKGRYRSKSKTKFMHGMPIINRPTYYSPEPTGFGEPPSDFGDAYSPKIQPTFIDPPPVDSYGAPLDNYNSPDLLIDGTQNFRETYKDPKLQVWEEIEETKEDPKYTELEYKRVKPKSPYATIKAQHIEAVEAPIPNHHFDYDLNSYSDVINYGKKVKVPKQKNRSKGKKSESKYRELVVGGQYAEPPARYVPRYKPREPSFEDGDFDDMEVDGSEHISSYVNYKNSNLAFSPQNLNDAFSIVDK